MMTIGLTVLMDVHNNLATLTSVNGGRCAVPYMPWCARAMSRQQEDRGWQLAKPAWMHQIVSYCLTVLGPKRLFFHNAG